MGNKMQTVKCGKCDGTGKLAAFGHFDNGKCYGCMGAGTVNGRTLSARKIAYAQAAHAVDLLEEIGDRFLTVNPDYSAAWVARAAAALLGCHDSAHARKQLDRLQPGMRAAVVAKGRALKGE